MESFTKRFNDAFTASGLSETTLAERMGVSQQSVNNWRLGKSHPKRMFQLARELNVSADWLINDKGPRERKADNQMVVAINEALALFADHEIKAVYEVTEALKKAHGKPNEK